MNVSNDMHYEIEILVATLQLTYVHMCEAFVMSLLMYDHKNVQEIMDG